MILIRLKDRTKGRVYKFVDLLDNDIHDDLNKIKYIDKFWNKTNHDFIIARNSIKNIGESLGGFDNLTDVEKKIYTEYSLSTKLQADSFGVSDEDRINNNKSVGEQLKTSRNNRVENARKNIGSDVLDQSLSYAESNLMYDDTKELFNKYIVAGDVEFLDWINSTGNHIGAGFSSKIYYTDDRKQMLIDIVITGKL